MAKRFTDTDIWKSQRWFRKLSPTNKLAFCYIKDNCNHAGVWKVDCSDLIDDLGLDHFDLKNFIESLNIEYDKVTGEKIKKERLIFIGNVLWLSGFIQYQYEGKDGRVNAEVAAVRSALHILEGLPNPYLTLMQPLPNPSSTLINPSATLTEPLRDKNTLLYYALYKKHVTLTQPLREGWRSLKDKDKDKNKDSTSLESNTNSLNSEEKNKKNGKQLVSTETPEQDYFTKRMERHRIEANQS